MAFEGSKTIQVILTVPNRYASFLTNAQHETGARGTVFKWMIDNNDDWELGVQSGGQVVRLVLGVPTRFADLWLKGHVRLGAIRALAADNNIVFVRGEALDEVEPGTPDASVCGVDPAEYDAACASAEGNYVIYREVGSENGEELQAGKVKKFKDDDRVCVSRKGQGAIRHATYRLAATG